LSHRRPNDYQTNIYLHLHEMPSRIISTIALVALGLSSLTSAHTWIEQMMVIAPNGTMVGSPGYARGNVLRSDPGFSDPTMVNLIPPNGRTINTILDTDLMCKSTQTTESQTNNSPRLQAAPGSSIALRYQENGHVTLPENQPGKPDNRGTVSLLGIHRVWTADGSGGDKRGVLLSTQNFDDGQCYQVNSGSISAQRQAQFSHVATSLMGGDLWCQQDIALPTDASGTYTLYWVWDWPTLPGTAGFADGKQEIYTTCMDVDVSGSADSQAASYVAGQSLDTAAISSEVADITNPTAVTGQTIAFSAGATAAASAISGTSTEFSITTDASGGHSIISASTAAVVPVAASATPSASSIGIFPTASSPFASSAATASAPATTADSGHHHGQAGATFTDWASVTMTVFQTVFNKRDLGKSTSHTAHRFHNIGGEVANASPTVIQTAPAPKPACSGSSTYTLRGRFYIPPTSEEC
jgi:hypothetical protein